MPKQKRDYDKIKMEFMLSDFDEVKSYITHKWITYNAERTRRTKWRWKEKQERKKKIYMEALKKKWKEAVDDVSKKLERYEMLWDEILQRMEEQFNPVGEDWKPRKINSNDIMNIWKIKRTEMWLPTNISKTENTNKEEKTDLTDEEMEALKELLKKSSK